jgi:uncharacterized membrane protein
MANARMGRPECARWVSVLYGLIFVALGGYAVTIGLYQLELYHLIWPFATGFVLVAPSFAVGVYELSHRMQQGQPITPGSAIMAWRRNPSQTFGAGLAMTFFDHLDQDRRIDLCAEFSP